VQVAALPDRPQEVVGGAQARPFVREMRRDWEVFEDRFSFLSNHFLKLTSGIGG
jgi:hypothetical protein